MTKGCIKNWCNFFKAVHDEHRQKILELLRQHQTLNASQIMQHINLSQPTTSHHLKILCLEKILVAEKNGKEVNYKLNRSSIFKCCQGFMNSFDE